MQSGVKFIRKSAHTQPLDLYASLVQCHKLSSAVDREFYGLKIPNLCNRHRINRHGASEYIDVLNSVALLIFRRVCRAPWYDFWGCLEPPRI
jgi:hypothetical protein